MMLSYSDDRLPPIPYIDEEKKEKREKRNLQLRKYVLLYFFNYKS